MRRLPFSLSFVLGGLCRLSGLAAAIFLVFVCLSRGLMASTPLAVLQVGAALLLAILIAHIVQEVTFALAESFVTACGHPFVRNSVTVTGRRVTEVWLPGGTWVRCETWRNGAALAWTEPDGSCTGIEMPALSVARALPPGTRKTAFWDAGTTHGPAQTRLLEMSAGGLRISASNAKAQRRF